MTATARALFVVAGTVWLIIGILTPFVVGRHIGSTMVFLSPRTDAALFGSTSEEILASPSSSGDLHRRRGAGLCRAGTV